jgi:hypothetical protein
MRYTAAEAQCLQDCGELSNDVKINEYSESDSGSSSENDIMYSY